jgi:hypothetical protein
MKETDAAYRRLSKKVQMDNEIYIGKELVQRRFLIRIIWQIKEMTTNPL